MSHSGKVMNGHGVLTSALSISNIGRFDHSNERVIKQKKDTEDAFLQVGVLYLDIYLSLRYLTLTISINMFACKPGRTRY